MGAPGKKMQNAGLWVFKYRDSGLREERLEQIGAAMQPGTSSLIAVVESLLSGNSLLIQQGYKMLVELFCISGIVPDGGYA